MASVISVCIFYIIFCQVLCLNGMFKKFLPAAFARHYTTKTSRVVLHDEATVLLKTCLQHKAEEVFIQTAPQARKGVFFNYFFKHVGPSFVRSKEAGELECLMVRLAHPNNHFLQMLEQMALTQAEELCLATATLHLIQNISYWQISPQILPVFIKKNPLIAVLVLQALQKNINKISHREMFYNSIAFCSPYLGTRFLMACHGCLDDVEAFFRSSPSHINWLQQLHQSTCSEVCIAIKNDSMLTHITWHDVWQIVDDAKAPREKE